MSGSLEYEHTNGTRFASIVIPESRAKAQIRPICDRRHSVASDATNGPTRNSPMLGGQVRSLGASSRGHGTR